MFVNHHLICHRGQERCIFHLSYYLPCPKHQSTKLRKGVHVKADHILLHGKVLAAYFDGVGERILI